MFFPEKWKRFESGTTFMSWHGSDHPGSHLGAQISQMPPQIPPRCLPDALDASQMPPLAIRCLQMSLYDASSMMPPL